MTQKSKVTNLPKVKKCLFPAAGYGTRFLPATKAVPKEMLPILTKPLLQYAVEEALDADIFTMAIVTGRGKRSIEDHFDNAFELESQLKGTSKEQYLNEIKSVEREFRSSTDSLIKDITQADKLQNLIDMCRVSRISSFISAGLFGLLFLTKVY